MERIVTFYLSAGLCIGAGALSLILASALKSGRRELGYFLGFFSTLMLLDASNFVLFVLGTGSAAPAAGFSPADGVSYAMYILMLVNRCLTVAICLSASLMAQAILDVPWKRWGTATVCAAGMAGTVITVLPPATRYDPAAGQVLSPAAFNPAVIVSLACIAYILVLGLVFRSRIPEKRTRGLVLAFFIVSAVFAPALARDITAGSGGGVISSLPSHLAFFPLYIAALSIAVFALAFPYLARERRAAAIAAAASAAAAATTATTGATTVVATAAVAAVTETADRRGELAARFGLTPREGEIMSLVAAGMSNKEIAFELGISDRTVGNHVFNLYRKLGINSRFELMGLMRRA